ncbi:MAG: serine/threonine-protein kinase [Myxococcota bacterium]
MTPPPPNGAAAFLGEGRYELMSPIADGSMGSVHLARHVALDRIVAIKLVSSEFFLARADADTRFREEGRLASRVRHKNAVHVLDFGYDAAHGYFLVMEYVAGVTLEALLERERRMLAPARCIAIAGQVLAALADAHDVGIVHRDIKPSNIMLVPGVDDDGLAIEDVKVFDFGIATLRSDSRVEGELCGTAEYMSPEQAQGAAIDARADLYSVGVLLYDMLSGSLPFSFESVSDVLSAQVSSPAPPLRARAPHVSPELAAVVARAMEKRREDRFITARAFRTALLATPEGQPRPPALASPVGVLERASSLPDTRLAVARPKPASAVRSRSGAARPRWPLAAASLILVAAFSSLALGRPASRDPSALEVVRARQPRALELGASRPELVSRPGRRRPRRAWPPWLRRARAAMLAPWTLTASAPPAPADAPLPAQAAADAPPVVVPPRAPASRPATAIAAAVVVPEAPPAPEELPLTPPPSEDASLAEAPAASPALELAPDDAAVAPRSAPPRARSARASFADLELSGGMARSSLSSALAAARPALEQCYRAAVAAGGAALSTATRVRLQIDVDRRARHVVVGALPLPGLARCAKAVLERVRVHDRPDMGTVAATFHLRFSLAQP